MDKTTSLILIAVLFFTITTYAQVAISDTFTAPSPDSSAVLDLQSFERGFLPPQMNQSQRDSISNPANGLIIYNITSDCIETHIQGAWKQVSCACTAPPAQPAAINGQDTVCPNQAGVSYTVATVPDANSYVWSVPTGASITTGQGTNSISVDFGASSGSVSVYASNSCGNSGMATLAVDVLPADASFTFNPSTPSIGAATNFTAAVGAQSYSWTFPSGSPSSSTIQNPSVTWSASGTYDVILQATRPGGCVDTDTQSVTVINCPAGSQTFSYTGSIQTWSIPSCVTSITIEAWGAEGGVNQPNDRSPGRGARMEGTFSVTGGQQLRIIVGQKGPDGFRNQFAAGGGGGASAVSVVGQSAPLIVAGGGGGAAGRQGTYHDGGDGLITQSGGNANPGGPSSGGTSGNGGDGGTGHPHCGAAGGGWYSAGDFSNTSTSASNPGAALNGTAAGGISSGNYGSDGGFGGGGAGNIGGGGGGGYSGGAGGDQPQPSPWVEYGGGGGGSFNAGTNQNNSAGTRSGNGQVIITW